MSKFRDTNQTGRWWLIKRQLVENILTLRISFQAVTFSQRVTPGGNDANENNVNTLYSRADADERYRIGLDVGATTARVLLTGGKDSYHEKTVGWYGTLRFSENGQNAINRIWESAASEQGTPGRNGDRQITDVREVFEHMMKSSGTSNLKFIV
jgi:hypothetical protein